MKRMLEEIIFNMKHAQFQTTESHIEALEYALSLLNKTK